MKRIDFACKTITPMFLAGENGETPELRPPSIKGLMRFWWRAVQRFEDPSALRDREAEIFGSAYRKSERAGFRIRIKKSQLDDTGSAQPLPHHREGWCDPKKGCVFRNNRCTKTKPLPCFQSGGFFTLEFVCRDGIDHDLVAKTFELSAILGGLGKRSRRGFGSFFIEEDEENQQKELARKICGLMNSACMIEEPCIFSEKQIPGSNISHIYSSGSATTTEYPQIKKILIKQTSEPPRNILIKIGEASHAWPGPDCGNGNPRLASPVYITLYTYYGNRFVIITHLASNKNEIYQQNFIDEVLSNV